MASKASSVQSEYMFSRSYRDSGRQAPWQSLRGLSSANKGSLRKDCTSNTGFGKSVWGIFCTVRFLDQPQVAESLMLVREMRKFDVASGDVSKAETLLDQLLVAGFGS